MMITMMMLIIMGNEKMRVKKMLNMMKKEMIVVAVKMKMKIKRIRKRRERKGMMKKRMQRWHSWSKNIWSFRM